MASARSASRKSSLERGHSQGRPMARGGSNEIRMPPLPQSRARSAGGATSTTSANFKPLFGTVGLDDPTIEPSSYPLQAGGVSEPLSRQTSSHSQFGVPMTDRARTQTSSPTPNGPASSIRFGTGPFRSQPNMTAPLPQQPFAPRPPRGRDHRSSFSGPGRARFPRGRPYTSPGGTLRPLDADSVYSRSYGMGYPNVPAYYPPAGAGYYDPWAAAQMGMYGGRPPAPMPQTFVRGLDPLRFTVLGQVEYYFSEQNMAMDLFLRNQVSAVDDPSFRRRHSDRRDLLMSRWTPRDGSTYR